MFSVCWCCLLVSNCLLLFMSSCFSREQNTWFQGSSRAKTDTSETQDVLKDNKQLNKYIILCWKRKLIRFCIWRSSLQGTTEGLVCTKVWISWPLSVIMLMITDWLWLYSVQRTCFKEFVYNHCNFFTQYSTDRFVVGKWV